MPTHHLDIHPRTDPDELLRREWLITNGTGAYSMGTVAGCNTRRYHGLFIAAGATPNTHPPVGRAVALNQIWEQLVLSPNPKPQTPNPTPQPLDFSTLLFRNDQGDRVYAPRGCALLQSFDRGLTVTWSYVWGDIHFQRELLLHWRQQAATIRYRITTLPPSPFLGRERLGEGTTPLPAQHASACASASEGADTPLHMTLRLYPMLALRDFHSLRKAEHALACVQSNDHAVTLRADDLAVTLAAYHMPPSPREGLGEGATPRPAQHASTCASASERTGSDSSNPPSTIRHPPSFTPRPHWWTNIWYPAETERGQDDTENYFVPGSFDIDLFPFSGRRAAAQVHEVALTVALGDAPAKPLADMRDRADHLASIEAAIARQITSLPESEISNLPSEISHLKSDISNSKSQIPNPQSPIPNPQSLALAADDFIVQRTLLPPSPREGLGEGTTPLPAQHASACASACQGAGIPAPQPNPQSPIPNPQRTSTIIAGYPWFADWGRDTFIALPGLLLTTGRFNDARATLRTFANAIADGLVPNRFDDYGGGAHYNTVDASLWFIRAACLYIDASNDHTAWRDWLAEACLSIIKAYAAGTQNNIRMEPDGLIAAGSPDTQLTWMDAADGQGDSRVVFTPRFGKCVEVNALWHHALVELSTRLPDSSTLPPAQHASACASTSDNPDQPPSPREGLGEGATPLLNGSEGGGNKPESARLSLNDLTKKTARSFTKAFWNDADQCLFDRIYTDDAGQVHQDATFRPNQVIALSLPHCPLPLTKQKKVLAAVRQRLLTPAGLRTLPVDDPHYHSKYTGPRFERDQAYHQGTVWPWLIGPYAEAVLRVGRFSKKAQQDAHSAIAPLLHQLTRTDPRVTLGQLPEIFDGDAPEIPNLESEIANLKSQFSNPQAPIPNPQSPITRRPLGCIAQAWSIAEVLRILCLKSQISNPKSQISNLKSEI